MGGRAGKLSDAFLSSAKVFPGIKAVESDSGKAVLTSSV